MADGTGIACDVKEPTVLAIKRMLFAGVQPVFIGNAGPAPPSCAFMFEFSCMERSLQFIQSLTASIT